MASKRTVHDDQLELDLGTASPARMEWPEPGELLPAALPVGRLDGFTTSVFAQVYARDYRTAVRLAEYTGVGAVLTLLGKGPLWLQARGPTLETKRRTKSLLVDANQYSGKNRKPAAVGMDPEWITHQQSHLGLRWALTNSGYAATLADVQLLIEHGSNMPGQSITALPMRWEVLRDDAPTIAWLIRQQERPVALMLEHKGDPFDDVDLVRALVYVIQHAGNPVLLLRCDVSALGAISHGAVVGAVGGTGLRHIYPKVKGPGGPPPLSFVIPDLLGYYTHTRFVKAFTRDPGHRAWTCRCWFCGGKTLDWLANQPREIQTRTVMSHSVSALAQIAERLAQHADPASGWTEMCAAAQAVHLEIANPSGSPWEPKPALVHWQALTPAAV